MPVNNQITAAKARQIALDRMAEQDNKEISKFLEVVYSRILATAKRSMPENSEFITMVRYSVHDECDIDGIPLNHYVYNSPNLDTVVANKVEETLVADGYKVSRNNIIVAGCLPYYEMTIRF